MVFVIRRYVCAVAFCAMLAEPRLDAQTLATVTGEVSDASGAAVAGATVTLATPRRTGFATPPQMKKAYIAFRR